VFHIYYAQALPKDSVTYILTTTQAWRAPFDTANYALKITPMAKIDSISMGNPIKKIKKAGDEIWVWQKQQFMPQRDFTIWY
jgi:hypothetical protein